jgi:hypothetical protein
MFELASAPALSVRDLAHLAFNAGQVRESGAIHNLERLAEENPDLAALRNIASVYDALRMGTLRAYI